LSNRSDAERAAELGTSGCAGSGVVPGFALAGAAGLFSDGNVARSEWYSAPKWIAMARISNAAKTRITPTATE